MGGSHQQTYYHTYRPQIRRDNNYSVKGQSDNSEEEDESVDVAEKDERD